MLAPAPATAPPLVDATIDPSKLIAVEPADVVALVALVDPRDRVVDETVGRCHGIHSKRRRLKM